MGEFEDKINDLLKSPESLGQIMKLARSLSGESNDESQSGPQRESDSNSSSSGNSGFSGGFDPQIMSFLGSALREYTSPSDKTALIAAIKPYLKSERQQKVDKALQIAKLAKVAKNVIPELGGSKNV
jgi:hypothetical protein